MPISAKGSKSTAPPTNIKHTINMGTVRTIRIVTTIFATPHVILNAKLIAFINNHIARIEINISINALSSYINLTSYPSKQPKRFMINS